MSGFCCTSGESLGYVRNREQLINSRLLRNTGFDRSDIRIIRIETYSAYGRVILARFPCVLSGVGTVLATGRSLIQRVVINIEKRI